MNRLYLLSIVLLTAGVAIGIGMLNRRAQPLYGHAVFGNQAVSADQMDSSGQPNISPNALMKAHFIVVGREIYFDSNTNQVPERSERFSPSENSFQVMSPDGKSVYHLTKAVVGLSPDSVTEAMPQHIIVNVDVRDSDQPEIIKFQQAGKVTVYPQAQNHGWAHFDGPLAFDFIDNGLALSGSDGPSVELRLAISTPAVACANSLQAELCSNPTTTLPGTLIPTAIVQFPTSSEETVTKRYDLDQFC